MDLARKKMLALLLSTANERKMIIEYQQGQRRAPKAATRGLMDHELTAEVRFADLEDDIDAAVAEATELLEGLHADIKTMVLTSLFGEDREPVTPAEAHEVIHALTVDQPEEMQQAQSMVGVVIAGMLAAAYLTGGRRVIEEADRQGVAVDSVSPVELPVDEFMEQGMAVAQHPWRRITGKVEEQLSLPSTLVQDTLTPDDVAGILDDIVVDGSRDLANQAVQTSAGRGRIDTVDSTDELTPTRVWSSEIMDGNQCDACELIDGREFSDMEEARSFYESGYYHRCRGLARCRGTLVWSWGE